MEQITIRRMHDRDVKEVAAIEQSIFSAPWSEQSFLKALQAESNIYLAAVFRENVIGYCGFWISYEMADLCNMAVAAPYRRQFVGQRLLMEGMAQVQARHVQRILLEVRESNAAAEALYRKAGFYEIGKRKDYYSNPIEDAILMKKIL